MAYNRPPTPDELELEAALKRYRHPDSQQQRQQELLDRQRGEAMHQGERAALARLYDSPEMQKLISSRSGGGPVAAPSLVAPGTDKRYDHPDSRKYLERAALEAEQLKRGGRR